MSLGSSKQQLTRAMFNRGFSHTWEVPPALAITKAMAYQMKGVKTLQIGRLSRPRQRRLRQSRQHLDGK